MAGFNTAVTGLKAATTLLDVAGNNIANSSTVGFKSSRTEFGDIYATAVVGAGSSNTPGSGVTVTDIAQDFSGGTIEFTNSNLDLAINGSGFFMLDDGQGNITYTRAGAFELDKDGNIVSKNGKYLQGYGLDALGNQLPVQNLAVTEKESPPKATERIGLSFNIDDNKDATNLSKTFSKTDPSSYTYSTTVGTFDSLGNEQSIRFYFAEQRPVREQHTYSGVATIDSSSGSDILKFDDSVDAPATAATTYASLSGISSEPTGTPATSKFKFDTASNADTALVSGVLFDFYNAGNIDGAGGDDYKLTKESIAAIESNADFDQRIDPETIYIDSNGNLHFEVKAEYSGYGDYAVTTFDGKDAAATVGERSASEVQLLTLEDDNTANGGIIDGSGLLARDVSIQIGGVDITLKKPTTSGEDKTLDQVGAEIASYEQEILDKNPDIQSVEYIAETDQIKITYKPEAGDVSPISVSGADAGQDGLFVDVQDASGNWVSQVTEASVGDNSYIGSYRAYAFLNDTDQLDLGKALDPGETSPENKKTEVGPIMINFNTTTGILEMVNGEEVSSTGQAPRITILGADPANPNDTVLESDVDKLAGIQLDISGSSQFASESIDKIQSQDGYTKGDLIGVTFAETGEMVASYSNGQRANLGLVAVATFENQDGLVPSGNTEWTASLASGAALVSPPGTGLNGTLRSAALEQSNVDLSAELVKLIEGQRNFQANSKTLETLNTITQSILQI